MSESEFNNENVTENVIENAAPEPVFDAESVFDAKPDAAPEPIFDSKPDAAPEPIFDSKPETAPEPVFDAESVFDAKPDAAPEPVFDSEPAVSDETILRVPPLEGWGSAPAEEAASQQADSAETTEPAPAAEPEAATVPEAEPVPAASCEYDYDDYKKPAGKKPSVDYGAFRNADANQAGYNQYQYPVRQSHDGFGIASMVLGIVSLFLFATCINVLTAILAIIFGIVQLVNHGNKVYPIVGIVTAAISLVLWVVMYGAFLLLMF